MTSWSVTSFFVQIRTSHITVRKQRWDDHLNTSCSVTVTLFPTLFLWNHHVYSPSSGYFKELTHQPGWTGGHYWHGFTTVYLLHSCSSFHSPGRMYSHRYPARSCRSRAATAAAPWRVRIEEEELRGERWGAALDNSGQWHEDTQRMGPNFAFWRETLPCRQTQALRIFGSTAEVSRSAPVRFQLRNLAANARRRRHCLFSHHWTVSAGEMDEWMM